MHRVVVPLAGLSVLKGRRPRATGLLLAVLASSSPVAALAAPPEASAPIADAGLPAPVRSWAENRERLTVAPASPAARATAVSIEVRAGGEPAAGVLLLVGPDRRPRAITGADGRLAFEPTWLGALLWLQTPAGRRLPLSFTERPEESPVVVVLPPARTLTGTVVDARTARPIAGATIWPVRQPWHAVRSGANGAFIVVAWDSGATTRLFAGAPDHLTVEIPAGTRTEPLEIRLAPAATLAGLVLTPDRAPLPESRITARPPRPDRNDDMVLGTAVSDAHGRFSIPHLPAGETVEITVDHPAHPGARAVRVEAIAGARPIELVLESAGWISGRVVTPEGAPIAGAVVTGSGPESEGFQLRTETRSDGEFRFGVPADVDVTLTASAPGHLPASRRHSGTQGHTDRLVFTLAPAASLDGRIELPDGAPAADALVTLVYDDPPVSGEAVLAMRTGEDGTFRWPAVPPGPLSLLAESHGFRSAARRLRLEPGANSAEIRLSEGLALDGDVVGPGGEPVAYAAVEVTGPAPGGTFSAARSDSRGRFRIAGLAHGSYELTARGDGYGTTRRTVTIRDGEPVPLEIRLEGGVTLGGRLLGLSAEEAAGVEAVEVTALGPNGRVAFGVVTPGGNDSDYEISGLTAGRWLVSAEAAGGRQARTQIEISTGETDAHADLDLDVAGGNLEGVVLLGAEPYAGAHVELLGYDGQGGAQSVTGADGEFAISGLPVGTYSLSVADDHGVPLHQEPIDLSGRVVIDVAIDASTVVGSVRDAGDTPISFAQIVFTPAAAPDGPTVRAVTDVDGRFFVPRISAGDYRIVVRSEGHTLLRSDLRIAGGGRVEEVLLAVPAPEGD